MPEEPRGVGASRTGITGDCEIWLLVQETKCGSSTKAVFAPNFWSIFPFHAHLFYNPPSPIWATHILIHVEPSAGTWSAYQETHSWRKLVGPLPSPSCQYLQFVSLFPRTLMLANLILNRHHSCFDCMVLSCQKKCKNTVSLWFSSNLLLLFSEINSVK